MHKIENYEKRLFNIVNKYKKIVDNIMNSIELLAFFIIDLTKKIVYGYVKFIDYISIIGRFMTVPFHWIWIFYDLKFGKMNPIEYPIFDVGGHYIYGKPGSGKSTLTYHAMMEYAYMTGKCALTTEQMEMPREKLNGSSYFYHQVFKPSDIFVEGQQVASFPEGFNFIVYEEMLTKYNQRNNKQSAYNNEVIPMIGAMGTQRHQGIDLFYFISQLPVTDVQIMLMLKGYHVPKIVKKFDYKHWLMTGKYKFKIKGWKVISYQIVPKSGNDYDLVKTSKWFYPCSLPKDMKYFNRLNMKSKYEALSEMKLEAYKA